MTTKVLVTSGNIGNTAIQPLVERGFSVSVTTRKIRPNPEWDAAGVLQVEFDPARPETLKRAFDGVERYLFVSPFTEDLVETGLRVVAAAKRAGIQRIVRSSSLGASKDAITMGRSHHAVEQAIEASGIDSTILRPASFMQNYLGSGIPESIQAIRTFYQPLGE